MTAWPLFGQPENATATTTCPGCGNAVPVYASYCESCGGPLTPTAPPPGTPPPADPTSSQTRRLGQRASETLTCPHCGGRIDADGYCQQCGARAPNPRDHLETCPAPWVAGVTDIGRFHSRNEDALALWADGERAVLVICDGVSTSADADVASLAAAVRAQDVLVQGITSGTPSFVDAVAQANQAVIEQTDPNNPSAASATLAAAVLDGDSLSYANLGDTRVYWIGETDAALLSTDDSMAQEFIDQGMARQAAEAMPQAHAITKWLGRDAEDIVPVTGEFTMAGPGWVLVCSDGLWNYASDAPTLAARTRELAGADDDPLVVARRLVEWANDQGGHDNITVALARHR